MTLDIIVNDVINEMPLKSKPLITQGSALLNLLCSLDYEPAAAPLGELLALYQELNADDWLVVTPVHWEATHNDAMIETQGPDLLLSEEESHGYFNTVKNFLKQDELILYYYNAYTWLVKVNNKPRLTSKPPHFLLNQSLMPIFSQLSDQSYWQKLLTELQMLLSSHPINQQRINQPSVNGLWFYGGGKFILPTNKTILTDDEQLMDCFPDRVKRINFNEPLKNNTVIFIQDSGNLALDVLSRYPVRWFWNNTAYSMPKKRWWQRAID